MVADSLLRILEKRRNAALRLGTFFVQVLGRVPQPVYPERRLPVHDTVLRPLLAGAIECRIYGVARRSPLFDLVSRLGEQRDRIWRLDTSRELIRGSEALWNSECQHNGIVIVRSLDLRQTEAILTACGRPDAWASRYQVIQGTSKAAVSYCFEVADRPDTCAFLFSGSNGLEWMDVFADSQNLALLWDQAVRKRPITGGLPD